MNTETMKRLLTDVKRIMKNPLTDNGVYYHHDENDMTKGLAMIVGSPGTPYFGGFYFFEFHFPQDYPYSPPKVIYMTNDGMTRFNPNLYKCGKVCLSILNTWAGEKWSSCQTISSVLLTLCTVLNETPLCNEPSISIENKDSIPYQKTIEYKNIEYAICHQIRNIGLTQFKHFYPQMLDSFLKNYDALLKFVESKENVKYIEHVEIYRMTTHINYDILKATLIDTKKYVEDMKMIV